MNRKRTQLLIMTFFVILAITGCTQIQTDDNLVGDQVKVKPDSATIRAEKLYQSNCSGCHGEQMMAFADRKWKHGKQKDSLIQSISNGYVEAGMPMWGQTFSETQIIELADYITDGIEHVAKYGFEKTKLASDSIKTELFTIILDTIADGLTNPWGMAFLPSGKLLVTEKEGILYLFNEKANRQIVQGVPKVRNDVQGGLLDIVLHPDFTKNNWLYISFSDYIVKDKDTLSGTAVNRYTFQDNALKEEKEIFRGTPYTKEMWHYGSRLAFDKEGYLYFTASDRARQNENPQNLKNPKGKIHRMYDDGRIPNDNPFFNQDSAIASIYTYGHRNMQGLVYDDSTEKFWVHEHGPRGGDELNIVKKGANYGWPVISYGINYNGTTFTNLLEKEGMEQPIHYWVPSIAPCGMTIVESNVYPGWEGDLLIGSLRYNYLDRCKVDGNKIVHEEMLMKNIGRLRNVKQSPDGYIYVAVENPGYIFKLVPLIENL